MALSKDFRLLSLQLWQEFLTKINQIGFFVPQSLKPKLSVPASTFPPATQSQCFFLVKGLFLVFLILNSNSLSKLSDFYRGFWV